MGEPRGSAGVPLLDAESTFAVFGGDPVVEDSDGEVREAALPEELILLGEREDGDEVSVLS